MAKKNTETKVDSTPQVDDSTVTDSRTEEALLADIVRNSDFVESLPNEQVPEEDTAETESEDPDTEEAVETEEIEEEDNDEEVVPEVEDDVDSTQDTTVFTPEELDLDAKVSIKIDGKETDVSFSDLIKGYSTEQSLSNKGRELGDARKSLEDEYAERLKEIKTVSQASASLLYRDEQALAKKFHDIEKKIDQARENGDTYEVGELKDQREQAQKNYWNARRNREALVQQIQKQEEQQSQQAWDKQMQHFAKTIPEIIPDYSVDILKDIREFALKEGISEETLDSVVDPSIIKFVDDYRRLKQGVSKGAAKRKTTPVKKVPVKKAKNKTQKQIEKSELIRKKALSPNSSQEDQMAFLRQHAEQSLGNNV